MSNTRKKTNTTYPEEVVTDMPTYKDVYETNTSASSPGRVGNRMYSNSGREVVSDEGGTSTTPMTYEQWYTAQQNKINQDTQAAKDLANINYQKSKSEYGSKAAALESMGLTGSGYSDYLNSQAYAQRQSAYANADAQRAQSMLDLDTKYMDILDQQKRDFVTAMGSITADTTDTEIEQMAALGFSPEQITSLRTQRDALVTKRTEDEAKATKDKQQSAYQTILGMINHETSDDMIDALAAAYGLTDADMIANAKTYQNTYLTDYLNSLDPTKLTVDDLNRYFPDKTGDTYTTLLNKIITSLKDSVHSKMFEGDDKATETATYNEIKNLINRQIVATTDATEKESLQDTLNTLQSAYDQAYNSDSSGNSNSSTLKLHYMPEAKITSGKGDGAYKNIVVTYGDVKYKIQYRDGWNEAATAAAKKANVQEGEVFAYGDVLYAWENGKAMTLEAREGRMNHGDYEALRNKLNS